MRNEREGERRRYRPTRRTIKQERDTRLSICRWGHCIAKVHTRFALLLDGPVSAPRGGHVHAACRLLAHISISPGAKKPPRGWAAKRKTAQGGPCLFNKSEVAQGSDLVTVLSIFEQQNTIWPIHIALGRSHRPLYAFYPIAVALPNLSGVDACHRNTLLNRNRTRKALVSVSNRSTLVQDALV